MGRIADEITNDLITGPPGWEVEGHSVESIEPKLPQNARKVFVVHGRNLAARDALFEFLRAVDLHPVEWSEAVQLTGKPSSR